MSRPSFQFYPDDWRANSNLRRCSWAARGVWLEVMCLMHDRDRYGTIDWPLKEIAQAVGCQVAQLQELVAKGVMKGCDTGLCPDLIYTPRSGRKNGAPVTLIAPQQGPLWFSSRMVRDEYLRTVRGESSRFSGGNGEGGNPAPKAPPQTSPKPPIGEGQSDGSTSSSSSPPSEKKEPSLRSGSAADAQPPAKTVRKRPVVQVEIPEWLPPEAWANWCEHRKGSKFTQLAAELCIRDLGALRDKGHDPTAVIEQSIASGWVGLFALKNAPRGGSARAPTNTSLWNEELERAGYGDPGPDPRWDIEGTAEETSH